MVLKRLKALFESSQPQGRKHAADQLQLAAAVLLVEAARMDGAISAEERAHIKHLLAHQFGLDNDEAETLVQASLHSGAEPIEWFTQARTLKNELDAEQRIKIIEMLWEVVYADGHLHDLESSLLRRVGGLLYVSDYDRGAARLRIIERLGIADIE